MQTPYYEYDLQLLGRTLEALKEAIGTDPYYVHYAIKANANPLVLRPIREAGLGVDCVSGGEIRRALDCGFEARKIVFAGVGKADWEIRLALEALSDHLFKGQV